MAEDRPLDPAKLMQAFFTGWNQARPADAGSSAPDEAPSPESSAMRLMAQALALANMPSREDTGGIADRLDRIEASLAAIAQRLDQLEAPVAKKLKKKR